MKHCVLLLAIMMGFINNTSEKIKPLCTSVLSISPWIAYYSPYHETVKDAHGIAAEMLKLRYLC